MKENHELSHLENEWKGRFDRFTAPEPTREQTLDLIRKIKEVKEVKPVDLRLELETAQENQSTSSRLADLVLSQWNFQGARSWLLTGIVMLILTITISQNIGDEISSFMTWIKWISLVMIAVMGYAFRAKNEGNDIIEKLSYTPLVQQMFTRFLIVLVLQFAISIPLSFVVLGRMNSVLYLLGSFSPLLFFGVVGFVGTIWFGQRIGMGLALLVWFIQVLFEKQLATLSLFQLPSNENFILMILIAVGSSCVLLSSVVVKSHQMRPVK